MRTDAAELALDERVDAVLCFCTHDILTSPLAMARAVALLRTGGRIVAAGVRRPDRRAGWLRVPGLSVSRLVFAVRRVDRTRRLVETRRSGAFYLVTGSR
jgi:hypothetical protein